MPRRNLAWMLLVVVIALLLWQVPGILAERDAVLRNFGVLPEIRALIHRYYVQPVDDARLTSVAVRRAAESMIEQLGDPHARYLDEATYEKLMRRTEGLTGGIGVEIAEVRGRVVIQSVRGASPADLAGLRRGDLLLEIDGLPLDAEQLIETAALLTGEPGAEVRLRVQSPPDAPREVRAVRQVLSVNPVRGWSRRSDGSWNYIVDATAGIAYVRLTEFLQNAPAELDRAINATLHEGARAWILDLRENRGGLLDAAISVADRFLPTGLIVAVQGTRGQSGDRREWSAQLDGTYPALPLVVLVNEWSASSSEIVAGALRDHRRAAIVGVRTYGKGSVQELFALQDGGAVKLTTRYYFLPGGECIQRIAATASAAPRWGVEPTEIVSLTASQREAWLRSWLAATWADEEPGNPATRSAAAAAEAARVFDAYLLLDPQMARAAAMLRDILLRTTPGATSARGSS